MAGKVSYDRLQSAAREQGVDPGQPYPDLREQVEVSECEWCDGEFVFGWTSDIGEDRFCSDTCEVEYINEYHR